MDTPEQLGSPGSTQTKASKPMDDLDQVSDLKLIDREYERLRKDMDNILSNRLKDMAKSDSRKFRLAIVPSIKKFAKCIELREKRLAHIVNVPVPSKLPTGLDTAVDEMELLCNQQDALAVPNRLETLIQFFQNRINALFYKRYLLLNRGFMIHDDKRPNAFDTQSSFIYEQLHVELDDVIERYHRLMAADDAKLVVQKLDHVKKSPHSPKIVEMRDLKSMADYVCKLFRERRDFDTYLARVSNLTTTDLEDLVQLVRENHDLPHSFRTTAPTKKPHPIEFITDYELILSWFNLDTTIEQDDGHALAYRCHKMFDVRFDQLKATPDVTSLVGKEPDTLGDNLGTGVDSRPDCDIKKPGLHHSAIKVVKASWNLFSDSCDDSTVVQKKERVDFQLRFEYDLVASNDVHTVRDHLKISQKHYVPYRREKEGEQQNDNSQSLTNSNPSPSPVSSRAKTLLGMLIPKSEGGVSQMTSKRGRVADFQTALEDPTVAKLTDTSIKNEMEVSMFFNPHEIFAFLQLRYLKTRELRLLLLRQLNFFRSIERRLNHDSTHCPYTNTDASDPLSFEERTHLGYNSTEKSSRNWAHDINQALEHHDVGIGAEDKRTVMHNQIIISNNDGDNIVYDLAYVDLENLETRLLRYASAVINRSGKHSEDQHDSMNNNPQMELRDQREYMNMSFTAPSIDRQQILLEIFESEVKFNERKVMLINALMELYEHVTWPEYRPALIRHIYKIINTHRCVLGASVDGLYRGTMYQMMSLQAQENLVIEILNDSISKRMSTDGFNFHHGRTVPIQAHEFLDAIGNVVKLSDMARSYVNDLSIAMMPFASVCSPLLEATVWQYMLKQWNLLSSTAFVLPETPRKLLFQMDRITTPEILDNILADVYGAENTKDSLVHPLLGNSIPATASLDSSFHERGTKLCVSFIRILNTYRQLKRQWLECYYLNNTLRIQTELLGVSHKAFLTALPPIPFDEIESGQVQTSIVDLSDEDEHMAARNTRKKQDVNPTTPLAISEFYIAWGNVSLEAELVIKQFVLEGPSILLECLRTQVLAKYTALTACETNIIILNRLEEQFKMGLKQVSTVYSGDLTFVGFFPNQFRRPVRRQMLSMYQEEWRKTAKDKRDKTSIKIKAFTLYAKHVSSFLQDQISRIQLIKIQRMLPASILTPSDMTSSLKKSISPGNSSGGESDQTIESMVDIGQGKQLRVFFALKPLDALVINRANRVKEADLANASSQVNSKLVQLYSYLAEIRSLAYVIGYLYNERGDESVRHIMVLIKKEILNFGSPLTMDKLLNYLSLRWTVLRLRLLLSVFSASYCLLASPTLQTSMKSFFAVYQYYRRIFTYPQGDSRIIPCGISPGIILASNSLSDLSLSDRKICSERFNEIETSLEDIFHQTNLESIEIENALSNQINYLKSAMRLFLLRFEFMSVMCQRKPIQFSAVSPFLAAYNTHVITSAHREFIASQRRKGSHVEDVCATRVAQAEFERCQVIVLQNLLTLTYTKCMMRAMKKVFDMLIDERTDALFSQRESILIHRPYFVNGYPVELRDFDFSHKARLFDELCHDIYTFSDQSMAGLPRGRTLLDNNQSNTLDVDPSVSFIIRRELFAQALLSFSSKLANWNQMKWKEIDEFHFQRNFQSLDLIIQQRNLIQTYTIEQAIVQNAYERDVRIGASIKATEIFLELSMIGSELSELKKSRRIEEKFIRAQVRQEYEALVAELSSIIHKLKARFNEFKINSVDEMLATISEVKKDDLLSFIGRDYSPNAQSAGETVIRLQETIDEIRSDNAELKQVMSKLKSMYALKHVTSKSAYTKTLNRLIEDKRTAEESMWESYRESEVREKVLRNSLVACQKGLVSIQTQHEVLKRQLKEERHAKDLLQKNISMHASENKTAPEKTIVHKLEANTRFEFEKVLNDNRNLRDECTSLRLEVARLQTILQTKEWRLATKQRMRKYEPSAPTARPLIGPGGSPPGPECFPQVPSTAPVSNTVPLYSGIKTKDRRAPSIRSATARRIFTIPIREELTLETRPITARRDRVITFPKGWNS